MNELLSGKDRGLTSDTGAPCEDLFLAVLLDMWNVLCISVITYGVIACHHMFDLSTGTFMVVIHCIR